MMPRTASMLVRCQPGELGMLFSELPATFEHELIAEVGFALALPSGDPLAERTRVSWPERV